MTASESQVAEWTRTAERAERDARAFYEVGQTRRGDDAADRARLYRQWIADAQGEGT